MIRREIFLQIVLCLSLFLQLTKAYPELELVQIIFRHGDRTPNKNELYPKVPYDPIYETLGYGQLTEKGKEREYRLGSLLRQRYNKFLGNVHRFGDVQAISTDFDRTKMSLELVLGGLYPPVSNVPNQVPWSPIPTVYLPKIVDTTMLPYQCSKYQDEVFAVQNSTIIRKKIAKYNDFFKYLAENTGFDMTLNPMMSTALVFHCLTAQKSMNIPLPSWATERVQKYLEEIVTLDYEIASYTTQMKRINGGTLLKQFIQNMNPRTNKSTPKMYLYSGHEINIAAFAKVHGLTEPKIPQYGSAIIVEKWRGYSGKDFIQMFLWTGVTDEFITYKLPKCPTICLYDRYLKLLQDVIPSKEELSCLWNNITKDNLRDYYNGEESLIIKQQYGL